MKTNLGWMRAALGCGVAVLGGCFDGESEDLEIDETAQEVVSPCTISLVSQQATVTLGQDVNFTATAACPGGATPVIRWHQKINNQFQIVGPESTSSTFTFSTTGSAVGPNVFKADVKEQGSVDSQRASNNVTVQINDNVPTCTNVKLTAPANGATATVGQGTQLTATANCGASAAEFQFWVKKPNVSNWTFLPGPYVAAGQSGLWVPVAGDVGSMNVRAAARSVGAHVQYSGLSGSVTVTVNPAAVNQPPTASNDSISTGVNVAGSTSLADNVSDPESNPLTITVEAQGASGTAAIVGTTATYTPNADFVGNDSFSYRVTDSFGGFAIATVSVAVINTAPTASDTAISTNSNTDGTVDVASLIADADTDPLTVSIASQPSSGSASATGTVLTYTPNLNFTGSDSFTYQLADNHGGSIAATVTVTVANQGPSAANDSISTTQNVSGTVDVITNDSDPEQGVLTVVSTTQGTSGAVSFNGTIATYTPNPFFTGSDSFTYTIEDAFGLQASATVNVTVSNGVSGCTASLSAPATSVFGAPLTLTATAACNTGAAEIQFLHKVNNAFQVIQPFGASLTAQFTPLSVGPHLFKVQVRTQGTLTSQAEQTATVTVTDNNTSFCSNPKVTSPVTGDVLTIGAPVTLTATASCTNGGTPEFQFWFKPAAQSNWTILPGFTTGSSQFTPAGPPGLYNIVVVTRSANDSHAPYQTKSQSITVTQQ
jgi:hypothetical protein